MGFVSDEDIYIPAPGHGRGYEYIVSCGREEWGPGSFVPVCKVRMVQPPTHSRGGEIKEHGPILGRQAPSFPNIEEWEAVREAMDRLMAKHFGKQPVVSDVVTTKSNQAPEPCPDWGADAFLAHLPPGAPVPAVNQRVRFEGHDALYVVKRTWDKHPPEAPGKGILVDRLDASV